ncbi:hypothetical protein BDZ91DRAFT_753734 [Kalaharituber pfeilii]|nr:hypothetical protein BDZ91DRAFT_753734 [Kalaharituber pfeilii]
MPELICKLLLGFPPLLVLLYSFSAPAACARIKKYLYVIGFQRSNPEVWSLPMAQDYARLIRMNVMGRDVTVLYLPYYSEGAQLGCGEVIRRARG